MLQSIRLVGTLLERDNGVLTSRDCRGVNLKRVLNSIICAVFIQVAAVSAQDWSPTRIVAIDYPVLAIQAAIAGTVEVKCTLEPTGKVLSTEIVNATGTNGTRDLLGKAAQQNVSQWVFSRSSSSKESPQTVIITYDFKFEMKQDPAYLRSRFIFDFPGSVHVIAEIPPAQNAK